MLLSNPVAWVDRALTRKWSALTEQVPESWLPIPIGGRKVKHFQEYGSGHYGSVYPTGKPGLVMKVTSDPTEAMFVAHVLRTKTESDGLVRYYKVFALEGESRRERPTFVLWRDEATHVGEVRVLLGVTINNQIFTYLSYMQEVANVMRDTYKRLRRNHEPKQILSELDRLSDWAQRDKKYIHFKGIQRLAILHSQYRYTAEEMSSTQHVALLGDAFLTYLREDITLADVHMGNIAIPLDTDRVGSGEPIIVDPGHAFSLRGDLEREPMLVI